MSCKDRLEEYPRDNGVPFQVQHHARVFTAQEVAAATHIPGKQLAMVVMAVAEGKPIMLAPAASYRVDRTKAAAVLGVAEVRLAEEQEVAATFQNCDVGAMPPFGNLYGVDVYVGQTLADDETIVMRAGTHTDTSSLRYADFARLVQQASASSGGTPEFCGQMPRPGRTAQ
jgi:Ala-tRNA(Pro) deacylase